MTTEETQAYMEQHGVYMTKLMIRRYAKRGMGSLISYRWHYDKKKVDEMIYARTYYMTQREVADHIGCCESAIKNWRKQGLPTKRVYGMMWFDRNEVKAWIKSKNKKYGDTWWANQRKH